MLRKYRTMWMVLSSLALAGLLVLGARLSLALANFDLMVRVTTASPANRSSFFPSLDKDGSKVAFESDSDFLGQGIPTFQREIWLYDTATMTLTRITTATPSGRISRHANLSGDGSKIVFWSDSDFLGQGISENQFEIWLYDTTTMTFTRITTASHNDRRSRDPVLSADGSKIVFSSDSDFFGQGIQAFQSELWLYDIAQMTLTRITTSSGSFRSSDGPSLNGDVSKIAFNSNADFLNQGITVLEGEIWLYDTATMTVTRITTSSVTDLRGSGSPSLSMDGTKMAFFSDSDFLDQGIPTFQWEIWLYDTTTMTYTRITTASPAGRDSRFPSMSGDGSKIVFRSDSDFLGQGIQEGQFEVWLYDTTTMTLTRLTYASASDRDSQFPTLSKDGSKIAFHSDSDFFGQGIPDSQNEIWLLAPASNWAYLPIIVKGS